MKTFEKLTPRELEVRALLERGMSNKAIAAALGIGPGTVKMHLLRMSEKTGVRGRVALAVALAVSGLKGSPPQTF